MVVVVVVVVVGWSASAIESVSAAGVVAIAVAVAVLVGVVALVGLVAVEYGLEASLLAELAIGVLAALWRASVGRRHVGRLDHQRVRLLVERLDNVEEHLLAIGETLGHARHRLRMLQRCQVHEHVVLGIVITKRKRK